MTAAAQGTRNWFDQGGQAYAQFRPVYPPGLARLLAETVPGAGCAVDVGCGSGQLTVQLAEHVASVIGVDPSQDQLAHATPHPNVRYVAGAAEQLPVSDGCAGLITAAQAAHWFDLPRFYGQARRIARPQAVLALVSYGVLQLEPALDGRFQRFYWQEIGPYWPPERKLVDRGYVDLPFPFDEIPVPALSIEQHWDLTQLLGYIATWSAVRQARDAGDAALLEAFAADLAALWGEPSQRRLVRWPLAMRVGRLQAG